MTDIKKPTRCANTEQANMKQKQCHFTESAKRVKLDLSALSYGYGWLGGSMLNNSLAPFTGVGLALVPIPPIVGKPTKAPRAKGWNLPRTADNPNG